MSGNGLRLPDRAQRPIERHGTRPEFEYTNSRTLIYIDGPHHQGDEQKRLDEVITARLEDAGYTVVGFGLPRSSWPGVFARFPDVFGRLKEPAA